jgi:hypothetical protein
MGNRVAGRTLPFDVSFFPTSIATIAPISRSALIGPTDSQLLVPMSLFPAVVAHVLVSGSMFPPLARDRHLHDHLLSIHSLPVHVLHGIFGLLRLLILDERKVPLHLDALDLPVLRELLLHVDNRHYLQVLRVRVLR